MILFFGRFFGFGPPKQSFRFVLPFVIVWQYFTYNFRVCSFRVQTGEYFVKGPPFGWPFYVNNSLQEEMPKNAKHFVPATMHRMVHGSSPRNEVEGRVLAGEFLQALCKCLWLSILQRAYFLPILTSEQIRCAPTGLLELVISTSICYTSNIRRKRFLQLSACNYLIFKELATDFLNIKKC